MAEKKADKKKSFVFAKGGNLASGTRFEPGQKVPDIAKSEFDVLVKAGAIKESK